MNILRIKEITKAKSLTGKELAEGIGVSQPAISDILQGKSFPRPDLLLKISKYLNVDLKDLFKSTTNHEIIKGYIEYEDKIHKINSIQDLKDLMKNIEQ